MDKIKLKKEILHIMDELHEKNKNFSDEEIDRDIEYAIKQVRSKHAKS